MKQLQLFKPEIEYSDSLEKLLNHPQTILASSNSGGKDSVAMLDFLWKEKYPSQLVSVHADLGLFEWPGTQEYCEKFCSERKIELITVKAKKSLLRLIYERYLARKGEVFWPSPSSRYCTSYQKKIPINKYLRRYSTIVNAVGIRSEESPARRDKCPVKLNKDLSSVKYQRMDLDEAISQHLEKPLGRLAVDWYPIFDWSRDKVLHQLGHSEAEWETRRKVADDSLATQGWRFHPAYVIGTGNSRLSCCYCIMGKRSDLENALAYNPVIWRFITKLEKRSGYSYQNKLALSQISQKNRK